MARPTSIARYNSDLLSFSLDAWSLYIDASAVVGLRMMKMAHGDAAAGREMALMINEKMQSAVELQIEGASGRLGTSPAIAATKIVRHYRRKVSANRRRLSL